MSWGDEDPTPVSMPRTRSELRLKDAEDEIGRLRRRNKE